MQNRPNGNELALIIFYKIINQIKNGIKDSNGNIRQYDVIDYYKNDAIDIKKLIELVNGKVKIEDLAILRKFIKENSMGKPLYENNKKQLLSVRDIRLIKDDSGKPIPGTEREITKEEKNKIFSYIERHNLPMYSKIYSTIIDRYLKGTINLEENIDKIKKV